MNFGSLFSGIGGLDLGLERAGMECKWQVEIDDFCQKVLDKHWPEVEKIKDVKDVYKFADEYVNCECCGEPFCERHNEHFSDCPCLGWSQWEDNEDYEVDLICGGFPCQDITPAANAQNTPMGLKGERSGLWFEMYRIISHIRPRWVVVENSTALTFRGLEYVLTGLAENGYSAFWTTIRASEFNAPHRRARTFIVANTDSQRLQRYVSAFVENKGEGRQNANFTRPTWWSAEPELDRVAHGIPNRVDRLKSLGNAVVPQVAEYIGRCILETEQEVK